MADQFLPNYLATAQDAFAVGHQQGAQRKAQENQSRLSLLASQAYGAPQDQRSGIVQQAIGIDPDAGFSLDKQLQGGDDAREQRLLNTARLIDQAPVEMKEAMYQRVRPSIEQHLPNLPPNYNDQVGQGIKAFIASRSGGDVASRVQSTYINAAGERVAIMRDGSQQVLGASNPNIRVLEQEGQLPYGVVTSGGVAGSVVPLGGGAAQGFDNGGGMTAGAGGASTRVNVDGMPPEQAQQMAAGVAALRQAGVSESVIEAFAQSALSQPRTVQAPQGGGPVRVPTSGEKAAAEAAARQAVELANLPERGRIEAENAAAKTAAEARAKTGAEVEAKEGTRARDAQVTLGLLDKAEQLLPNATGGGAGARYDQAAAFFGQSTPGAQTNAQLNLIAAQLVAKVPRFEGPQSNIDVQFYREAAGDLANPEKPVATRMAALRTMRALQQKYVSPSAPAAPSNDARRALLDKY